jgi:hypothetical protein
MRDPSDRPITRWQVLAAVLVAVVAGLAGWLATQPSGPDLISRKQVLGQVWTQCHVGVWQTKLISMPGRSDPDPLAVVEIAWAGYDSSGQPRSWSIVDRVHVYARGGGYVRDCPQ